MMDDEIVDLVAACADDPLLFVRRAYDWGHGELEGMEPEPWQIEVLEQIGLQLRARTFPVQIAVASGHGVGKSALVAWVIDWAMSTAVDTRVVVTAMTDRQLRTKTWATLATWRRRSLTEPWFELTASAMFAREAERERTWRADAVPWSERNTEAFAGLHNFRRRILVIMDEASGVPDPIWEVIEGALTDEDTEIIWLVLGNPTRNVGRFRECWRKFKHRWWTKRVDSRTVRIANRALLDRWIADYGEDSDFARVRVLGKFPSASSTGFFDAAQVRLAVEREPHGLPDDPIVLGVDVAREGDDRSVIAERRGHDCRSWPWDVLRESDTMQLVGRIVDRSQQIRAQQKRWPDAIFVDATGVGGPVVDRLRQVLPDVFVQGVTFGAGATGPVEGFRPANRRAEIYVRARLALPYCSLPASDDLEAEFEAISYGYAADQASIRIDKKEDIKRELGRSPDLVDAFALLFTMPIEAKSVTALRESAQSAGATTDWFDEWRPKW